MFKYSLGRITGNIFLKYHYKHLEGVPYFWGWGVRWSIPHRVIRGLGIDIHIKNYLSTE